jgi:hypothetical protein
VDGCLAMPRRPRGNRESDREMPLGWRFVERMPETLLEVEADSDAPVKLRKSSKKQAASVAVAKRICESAVRFPAQLVRPQAVGTGPYNGVQA